MSVIEKVQKFAKVYEVKRVEIMNRECRTLAGAVALVAEYKNITGEKSGSINDAAHFFAYRAAQQEVKLF